MRTSIVTAALALTLLGGVGAACTTADPVEQSESQDVTERGALQWGEPVEGQFVQDFEYHAYTLDVAAGSRITLEITQQGSSRDLSTVMVLYGPPQANGERERLAVDYDSGWGGLSKLKEVTLVNAGLYLVTVGTATGLGRGNYRLLLSCEAGNCVPEHTPLELVEGEPNTEFMETMNNYDSEYCYRNGRAFSYSEEIDDPPLLRAGAAILKLYQEEYELLDDEIEYGGEVTLDQFDEWLQYSGLDRGTFEGAVGIMPDDTYRVGEVLYEYGCAASVTCSGTVMVALIPSWHEVWTVEFGCGDE